MLINLKNANICQREGRLVLGNVNKQGDPCSPQGNGNRVPGFPTPQ